MGPSVLIVDDHAGFRSAARLLLEAEGFMILGEAADGCSAIRVSSELRPDLVLLDIQLPDMDGFEVADRLAGQERPPAVILISSRNASDYRARLQKTTARGFIAKGDLSASTIGALMEH